MRRILIAVAALLGLAGAAWLALPSLLNVEQFRGLLRAQLEQQLARKVEFGAMRLELWPLSISLADLNIGEAEDFPTGKPFLTAKSLSVRVEPRPLLNKDVRIQSLEIREPRLELVKQGERWNYTTLGRSSGSDQPSQVRLAELVVVNGVLGITSGGPRQEYDRIDLTLRDIAPGQPFGIRLSTGLGASFEGQGNPLRGKLRANEVAIPKEYRIDDRVTGESDLDSQGTVITAKGTAKLTKLGLASAFAIAHDTEASATKLERVRLTLGDSAVVLGGTLADLAVQVEKLTFPDTVKAAQALRVKLPAGLTAKGVASGQVRLRGTEYSGRLQATDLELSGPALKQPVKTSSLAFEFTPQQVRTSPFVVETAGSKLEGSAVVDAYQSATPRITASLRARDAEITDLIRVAHAYGAMEDEKFPGSGRVTLDLKVTGSPANPSIAGTLDSPAFKYQDLVFTNLHTQFTNAGGMIKLEPFNAGLFGGQHTGSITVDPRGAQPRVWLHSKLARVEANEIVSAFTPLKQALYGRLAAEADLELVPGADLTKSLKGNLKMSLADGKLMGFNLLNEIAGVAKFLKWAKPKDEFTNFLQLTGSLRLADGVATSDDLRIQLDQAVATTTGSVNLLEQTLRMKVAAVLGRSLSEEVGGSKVGGFLNTAFTNKMGELVVPTLVTGSFKKPRFAPDPEAMAKNKIQQFEPEKAKEQIKQIFDIFKKKKQ